MTSAPDPRQAQGGGYPPGGYGPPGGPGGYGPPGGPSGYGPPGGHGPPAAPYGAPFPPPGGAPLGPSGGSPNSELKKRAQTWLVIAGVSSILCSCLVGLIGGYFCYMAMQASDQGNLADAETKLRWGKIITIVGLAAGTVFGVFSLIYAVQMVPQLMGP